MEMGDAARYDNSEGEGNIAGYRAELLDVASDRECRGSPGCPLTDAKHWCNGTQFEYSGGRYTFIDSRTQTQTILCFAQVISGRSS
jgi:hypothetical protein